MDFTAANVLLILSAFWAFAQAVRFFAWRPFIGPGWLAVALVILASAGYGLVAFPAQAGYLSGAVFLVLVLLPSLALRRMVAIADRGDYGRALGLARLVAALHPADGMPALARTFETLRAAQQGRFGEAEAMVERLLAGTGSADNAALFLLLRIQGRDEDVLRRTAERLAHCSLDRAGDLLTVRLGALAETGRLAEAFALYRRMRSELPPRIYAMLRYRGPDLYLAMFGGREAHCRKLNELLGRRGMPVAELAQATARLTAGETDENELRELLARQTDAILYRRIERRLALHLEGSVAALTDDDRALLDQLEKELDQTLRYGVGGRQEKARPAVTQALALVVAGVFAVELAMRGETDTRVLWLLGAMPTAGLAAADWWRVPAHLFVHFGWPHVVMNVLALFFFGPFVERSLGRARYLATYLVSGCGAALLAAALVRMGLIAGGILVGASGAIMGLLGATGSVLLRGWCKEAADTARRRLLTVIVLVLVQAGFDHVFPQVAWSVHLLGALIGFVTAWVLAK